MHVLATTRGYILVSLLVAGASVPGTGVRPWCQLAYWELADRVGRLYSVQGPNVNVSAAAEPSNQGLCLATLANHAPIRPTGTPAAVERTRAKIGLGKYLEDRSLCVKRNL